jgi:hypothetical protein
VIQLPKTFSCRRYWYETIANVSERYKIQRMYCIKQFHRLRCDNQTKRLLFFHLWQPKEILEQKRHTKRPSILPKSSIRDVKVKNIVKIKKLSLHERVTVSKSSFETKTVVDPFFSRFRDYFQSVNAREQQKERRTMATDHELEKSHCRKRHLQEVISKVIIAQIYYFFAFTCTRDSVTSFLCSGTISKRFVASWEWRHGGARYGWILQKCLREVLVLILRRIT